ncbi:hypothetical protein RRF57_006720 [Xylaria bambusicola]|uniref:Uncharacterized protein n=1 Tax=Xylaria bambusicola TaxID=326684 RepID=A0AAN7UEU4_9PEZI
MATEDDYNFYGADKVIPNNLEWFDENAAHEDESPKDPDPRFGPVSVDLYEQKGRKDGPIKAYFKGDESSSMILDEERSNYYLAVKRRPETWNSSEA